MQENVYQKNINRGVVVHSAEGKRSHEEDEYETISESNVNPNYMENVSYSVRHDNDQDSHSYQGLRNGVSLQNDNVYLTFRSNTPENREGLQAKAERTETWKKMAQRQSYIIAVVVFLCFLVTAMAICLAVIIKRKDSEIEDYKENFGPASLANPPATTNTEKTPATASGQLTTAGLSSSPTYKRETSTTTGITEAASSTLEATTGNPASTTSTEKIPATVSAQPVTVEPAYTSKTSTTTSITVPASTTTEATTEALSVQECSKEYQGLLPHPDECQAYYNCSDYDPRGYIYYTPPYYTECRYPDLFNVETMSCDNFENVRCNGRKEAKDGCDYTYLQCGSCTHCSVRYPSCTGKPTGFNFKYQPNYWSPFFITCYKERFMYESMCSNGLFSPDSRTCVTFDHVPEQHGGYMLNCTDKPDGLYPNKGPFGCKRFNICENGRYVTFGECRDGKVFDEVLKTCRPRETASICICEQNC